MWRQLLARLHPDVGGDPELFLFVCSIKDQLCEPNRSASSAAHHERGTEVFLCSWHDDMVSWASRNRDRLNVNGSPGGAPYTR